MRCPTRIRDQTPGRDKGAGVFYDGKAIHTIEAVSHGARSSRSHRWISKKPRAAVEKEIEIYRETLKIAKLFTPDDLQDMSFLKKVQDVLATQGR